MASDKTGKIGVGVVGFGMIGEHYHAALAASVDGFFLAGICDAVEARLDVAREKFGCPTYLGLDELLANDDVSLVAIGTPPNMHCDQTLAALAAGKNVLVDKPFSMTYAQAKRMIAAASDAGVLITANQNRRWDSDYLTVKKAIADGLLGDVYDRGSRWSHFTKGWTDYGVNEFNATWRIQKAYGGGMVYDYASHLGDQMLRMVDSPVVSVYAELQSRIWSDEVDDHWRAELRFADDTVATVEATNNWRTPMPRWFVTGTKGTLVSQPVGGCDVHVFTDEGEQVVEPVTAPRSVIYDNLADVLLRGAEPFVKPEHPLEATRLIQMIFDSAETGEVVHAQDYQ